MCVAMPRFLSFEEGEKWFRRYYGYFDSSMSRYLETMFPAPAVEIKKELPKKEKKRETVAA